MAKIVRVSNLCPLLRNNLLGTLGFFFVLIPICLAQGNGAPNWRDTPVPMHVHPDTATPRDRQARDGYFARIFPSARYGLYPHVGGTATVPDAPEIQEIPGSFWVVGTFLRYDTYEISTEGIYTEIHFRIDHTIGSAEEELPKPGAVIDIDIPGGTVLTSSGDVHHKTGWKEMYDHAPNPNGRYLIQLIHVSEGNFYKPVDYWEITAGVLKPMLPKDVVRARDGKSRLAGMSEAGALVYLQTLVKR